MVTDLARLVGFSNIQETLSFHIPSEGEPPYDDRDISTHRLILRLGKVAAGIGVFLAVGFVASVLLAASESRSRSAGSDFRIILFSIIVAPAIPVVAYFLATSVGLLIAPFRFLRGPIGQKWLKVAGVKSIGFARVLCLAILLGILALIAVIALVVVIALNS